MIKCGAPAAAETEVVIRSEVMMNIPRLATLVVLLVVLPAPLFAGIRGPGQYCGVVVYDRWDGCTLYSGIYVMYISEGVKAELQDHAGECVQIDAKRVHQPINPGDGLISEFVYLGPAPPANGWASLDGLSLHVAPAFANGERPNVKISIQNSGEKDVKVFASEFAPTLLAKKGEKDSFFIPSDGPSFALITRNALTVGPDHEPRTSGCGTRNGQSYVWNLDAAVPDTFILKPGEESAFSISFDLPPGEYDFLAGYGGGVHAGKCLASNLVAFDVDEAGKATLADTRRR